MKIIQEIEVHPFGTPNYIVPMIPVGKKEDGIKQLPGIPITEVSSQVLCMLCVQFVKDVYKKAGKEVPDKLVFNERY